MLNKPEQGQIQSRIQLQIIDIPSVYHLNDKHSMSFYEKIAETEWMELLYIEPL